MKKYTKRIEGTMVGVPHISGSAGDWKDLKATLAACTPRGEVSRWRALAEKHGFTYMLDEAEELIDAAGNIPSDRRDGFRLLMTKAKIAITAKETEPTLQIGVNHRVGQSDRGKRGAAKRWAGPARDVVGELIDALKGPKYEDWTSREKWNELIGLMDGVRLEEGERLDPVETWVKGDATKSTISYNGDNGKPLTYQTFKNRLSEK